MVVVKSQAPNCTLDRLHIQVSLGYLIHGVGACCLGYMVRGVYHPNPVLSIEYNCNCEIRNIDPFFKLFDLQSISGSYSASNSRILESEIRNQRSNTYKFCNYCVDSHQRSWILPETTVFA